MPRSWTAPEAATSCIATRRAGPSHASKRRSKRPSKSPPNSSHVGGWVPGWRWVYCQDRVSQALSCARRPVVKSPDFFWQIAHLRAGRRAPFRCQIIRGVTRRQTNLTGFASGRLTWPRTKRWLGCVTRYEIDGCWQMTYCGSWRAKRLSTEQDCRRSAALEEPDHFGLRDRQLPLHHFDRRRISVAMTETISCRSYRPSPRSAAGKSLSRA